MCYYCCCILTGSATATAQLKRSQSVTERWGLAARSSEANKQAGLVERKVLVPQSCPTLCASWTVALQALLSTEFSKQEYWSGQPFPSPGELPDPGIKPGSPALHTDSLPSEPPDKPNGKESLPYFRCWKRSESQLPSLTISGQELLQAVGGGSVKKQHSQL